MPAYFQLFIQDRNYNITNEDKLMYARVDHLSQSYQHFINTYCGGNKNVVLDAMRDYALCFMNTFRLDQCERSVPSNFGVERINVVIFGLKNTTMIPYILFVAKNVYRIFAHVLIHPEFYIADFLPLNTPAIVV